ncbi:MFS transporter [Veillonella sp.]|uniref:MFS transporter n=1 Tax=Veillonella sp. TaxID=1926307 RepID=UPI0025CF1779|nr:MFS transporter [Veillonella sp.]
MDTQGQNKGNTTQGCGFMDVACNVKRKTWVRWAIVWLLFIITAINYADRATISIAGTAIAAELGFSNVDLGYVFSAWGWAYVICQLPGGWLLDRYGTKRVYAYSLFFWSLFTMLQGAVVFLHGFVAMATLFAMRFLLGVAEAPSFPGNSRIVAAWFPSQERGTASAIFNAAQYFASVIFVPMMGWIVHTFGWHHVFTVMGAIGLLFVVVWRHYIHDPAEHPHVNAEELEYIKAGGGLVSIDSGKKKEENSGPKLGYIKQLFSNRMCVGVYVAQYCINALTFFFITWFPVYLVQARGMTILKAGFVASLPAICGFLGGILGGLFSDFLLHRGYSLSVARKVPIVVGMLLAMSMIICNYTDNDMVVVALMALAFFGKAFGALGWAVNSDIAPKQIVGLSGGVMNMCGNLSSIVTPIVIGYIVNTTGSFDMALLFVGIHAFVALASYLVVVGDIHRFEIKPLEAEAK